MSSWIERLRQLDLPTNETYPNTEAVYVDGSKFTKKTLLDEIAREYPWANISNIKFENLYTLYNQDITKVLSHLFNERYDPMIYENSNQCLNLMQIIQQYMLKYSQINLDILLDIYETCCDHLQYSSTSKSILILNCQREYFKKYSNYKLELYLRTFAYLALLHKRCLFPFMDVIVIRDKDISTKNIYLQAIYKILNTHLYTSDKIIYSFNKNLIKTAIVNAHKANTLIEFDLC